MAFRTDLAVEAIENHKTAAALPHVRQSDRTLEGFAVHEVRILSEDAAREIGKPQGCYLTLELDALIRREEDAFPRACKALSTLLRELLPRPNDGPVLIAGLGNRMITPDAIGPQTAD
ncbi:MAG: GPR endopeptidase, partial [Butyricicoccus sp.]